MRGYFCSNITKMSRHNNKKQLSWNWWAGGCSGLMERLVLSDAVQGKKLQNLLEDRFNTNISLPLYVRILMIWISRDGTKIYITLNSHHPKTKKNWSCHLNSNFLSLIYFFATILTPSFIITKYYEEIHGSIWKICTFVLCCLQNWEQKLRLSSSYYDCRRYCD